MLDRRKLGSVLLLLLALFCSLTLTHLPIQPLFRFLLALMTVTALAAAARQLWTS